MPRIAAPALAARAPRILLALLVASTAAGCSSIRPVAANPGGGTTPDPGGVVLTQDDIRDLRARDAMEALERSRTSLRIDRSRSGSPVSITRRGVGSLVLSPEVLVIVDGARVSTPLRYLESIPAESIRFIQVLSGREAALKWGSEAGNGVIVVVTSASP